MQYRLLGSTGLSVSAIGLGGWEIGGGYGRIDDTEYQAAVHHALDMGINCFDTAWSYGSGRSEQALGQALGKRRYQAIIITKFGVGYSDWNNPAERSRFRDTSRQRAIVSIEESLRNLGTDYVDVYLVHWPDPNTPFEETMQALSDIVRQGKARFVGVSNFRPDYLEKCMVARRVDVVQYCWNMMDRRAEDVFYLCRNNDIGFVAYGPLAYGMLTGTFTSNMRFEEDDWRSQEGRVGNINLFQHLFGPQYFQRNLQAIAELKSVAARYGKSLAQFALNWSLSHSLVSVALVGCRNKREVDENLGALGWAVSHTDSLEVDRIFRRNEVVTKPNYWIDSD